MTAHDAAPAPAPAPVPTPGADPAPPPPIREIRLRGFRSAQRVTLRPGPVCALVGGPQAGKSNLLAAIHALLDPAGAALTSADVARGAAELHLSATLGSGETLTLTGAPPRLHRAVAAAVPPVLYLPAAQRLGEASPAGAALAVIDTIAGHLERGSRGWVVLIEEPELYLRPQAQRYFHRLLRAVATAGNQVVYATHSPAFLDVTALHEIVFVEREPATGSRATRPPAVSPDEDFRVLSEFDAERAELLFARAALLVEGRTEKLALPFVFAALGADADREGISIVECGGKSNLPFFARVCTAARVPFVVLHDRDRPQSRRAAPGVRRLNERIAAAAPAGRTIVLDPDFERVAGLRPRHHKAQRAWEAFARRPLQDIPEPLRRAAALTLALAR